MWEALRDQLPDEAALFHSVNLLEGDREHEIDLLVAWPGVGLAAIEVKGGHVRRDAQGWHQESRGQRRPIGARSVQAQDGKKVADPLPAAAPDLGRRARPGPRTWSPCPSRPCPRTGTAPDLPRTALLDKDRPRRRRDRGARARSRSTAPVSSRSDDAGLEAVVALLAGQLVGQTSLLGAAEEHEQRVEPDDARPGAGRCGNLRYHRRLRVDRRGGDRQDLARARAGPPAGAGRGSGSRWSATAGASRATSSARPRTWPDRERPAYVGLFHQLPVDWGAAPPSRGQRRLRGAAAPRARRAGRGRPRASGSTASSSTRPRTSASCGGRRCSPACATPTTAGCSSSSTRRSGCSPGRGRSPIDLPPYVLDENIRNTKRIAQLFSSLSGERLRPARHGRPAGAARRVRRGRGRRLRRRRGRRAARRGLGAGPDRAADHQHRHTQQREAVDVGGWRGVLGRLLRRARTSSTGTCWASRAWSARSSCSRSTASATSSGPGRCCTSGCRARGRCWSSSGERALVEQVGGGGVAKRLAAAQRWRPAGS